MKKTGIRYRWTYTRTGLHGVRWKSKDYQGLIYAWDQKYVFFHNSMKTYFNTFEMAWKHARSFA